MLPGLGSRVEGSSGLGFRAEDSGLVCQRADSCRDRPRWGHKDPSTIKPTLNPDVIWTPFRLIRPST